VISNLADFYRSKSWESFIRVLADERADDDGVIRCEHCGLPIVLKYDRIAHHKKHLTLANVNDAAISLNPENIALVHHKCHNEIHERFGFAQPKAPRCKKVYLIHGSPCSGKSTYTASVAGPGDIILDMDAIWACISAQEAGGHFCRDERLRHNVFRVRDCMLDMIKTRYGEWANAYIIGGYPRIMERERMASLYGAEIIHIDTPKEICLQRASQRPKEWAGYIENYWETFQE
jgi:adenylate kinase family enzyme